MEIFDQVCEGAAFLEHRNDGAEGCDSIIGANIQSRHAASGLLEPMLAAAAYPSDGTIVTVGTEKEFQYSFRAISKGAAMSVMVLDFFRSFPYVAMVMKPGTVLPGPILLPF